VITLNWANSEYTLLIWQFSQRWSGTDFLMACQQSQYMLKQVDHSVNILIDLSKSRFYPTNLIYLAYSGMQMRSENTGTVVIVSESQLWSRLYHHLNQIYSWESRTISFASSLEDARRILQNDTKLAMT